MADAAAAVNPLYSMTGRGRELRSFGVDVRECARLFERYCIPAPWPWKEGRSRIDCGPSFFRTLQGVKESDEVLLFVPGQIHLEALVVEVQKLGEVARGAVVEVRSAGGESAKDGAFCAADVAAQTTDQRFTGIGSENDEGSG